MGTQWRQLCLVGAEGGVTPWCCRGGKDGGQPCPYGRGGGGLFWWRWFSRPPPAALKEIQTNRRGSCAAET